jgi:hypothetical protein
LLNSFSIAFSLFNRGPPLNKMGNRDSSTGPNCRTFVRGLGGTELDEKYLSYTVWIVRVFHGIEMIPCKVRFGGICVQESSDPLFPAVCTGSIKWTQCLHYSMQISSRSDRPPATSELEYNLGNRQTGAEFRPCIIRYFSGSKSLFPGCRLDIKQIHRLEYANG